MPTDTYKLVLSLANQTVLDIICTQVELFVRSNGVRPETVQLNYKLRPSFIKNLMQALDVGPNEAVAEPIWLDGIPVIFSVAMGERFLILSNRAIRKEIII